MEDHYRDEGTYQETLFTAFMGRITILAWWSRNRTEKGGAAERGKNGARRGVERFEMRRWGNREEAGAGACRNKQYVGKHVV